MDGKTSTAGLLKRIPQIAQIFTDEFPVKKFLPQITQINFILICDICRRLFNNKITEFSVKICAICGAIKSLTTVLFTLDFI